MVDKIRKHIYAQKAKLIRGACAAQVAMETACKEEAYDEILAYIDKLEKREGPNAMERYDVILWAAQKAVGAQLTAERTMENTDIRMLVVKQMRDEGYSNAVIGVLIRRDHSTVSYLFKCVNEMLAMREAFSKFMHVYDRFKEYLEQ
jgi:hypothetical protein